MSFTPHDTTQNWMSLMNNGAFGPLGGPELSSEKIREWDDAGDIGVARAGNPLWYEDPENPGSFIVNAPYDPNGEIAQWEDRLEGFQDMVDEVDPEALWDEYVDAAKAKAEEVLSTTEIDAAVSAYDTRQQAALLRRMNQVMGGMADVNAVQGSAFPWMLANMNLEHKQAVDSFAAELDYNAQRERMQFIAQGSQQLSDLKRFQVDATHVAAHITEEFNRIAMVARTEFDDSTMKRRLNANSYNLELWQYGANMVSGIHSAGGAPIHPGRGDTVDSNKSALGGALAGAAFGAQLGAPSGNAGFGALLGAGAGALVANN